MEALAGPKLTDEQRAIVASKQAALNAADAALTKAIADRDQASAAVASANNQLGQLQSFYAAKQVERDNALAEKQVSEKEAEQTGRERNYAYIAANSGNNSTSYIDQLQESVISYSMLVDVAKNNIATCEGTLIYYLSDLESKKTSLEDAEANYNALTASSDELLAQLSAKR